MKTNLQNPDHWEIRHTLLILALSLPFSLSGMTEPVWADDVPTDGMLLWLRADRPGELDGGGGASLWPNRAPQPVGHAVQVDAAKRPGWVESVAGLGGLPAFEFDGEDDFYHVPWLTIGSRATVIMVVENARQTEGGSHWRSVIAGDDDSFCDDATKYSFGFRRAGLDPLFVANLYYAPKKPHRLTEPVSRRPGYGFHAYSFRRDAGADDGMTLRVDGLQVAALTAQEEPPDFPGTGYTVGQGGDILGGNLFRCYRGRIAEILVYDRALAEVELLRVEKYLADKYGLRSEDAPPTQGLTLWLKADTAGATGADAPANWVRTAVELWEDQSGQGHHGRQADAALRPVRVPRAVNRRPAIAFGTKTAQLDFGDWLPPAGCVANAALRETPDDRVQIVRQLPTLNPAWRPDTKKTFGGSLFELLVYDRELAADETDSIERYLRYRYSESTDRRLFDNGTLIFRNGYTDQPYVVKCLDDSWLSVITTSRYNEQGADRTLVVTKSRDRGRSWSPAVQSIEPAEMRQPSWATLYVTPYGRVYVFYNLREKKTGPSPIGFFCKYSDDHGETWSAARQRLPIRKIALDSQPGRVGGVSGWSVCPPIEVADAVLLSYTRFAGSKRSQGQGFVFKSDNLQTERDPAMLRWEMLPAGDRGIRADGVPSEMQEEHIITPLGGGDLLCIWRSTSGYACQSYSRDGGRTWADRDFATYVPDGRRIKQPLACCRPFRTASGRYLLWFHNSGPASPTAVYRPRDVVWLASGEEKDGRIHWSQPEVFLYGFDLPVRHLGMSYPDFIEEDGRFWLTTTDKEETRMFSIDPALLKGLWGQQTGPNRPICDWDLDLSGKSTHGGAILASPRLPSLPSLLHGGFTVDLTFQLETLRPGQILLDCRSSQGCGWTVATVENGSLNIELSDGRHAPEGWNCDPGLLETGRPHHVTFIVDGGPNLILILVDGVLCDGGPLAQRGWGRFSPRLDDVTGEKPTLHVGPSLDGAIHRLRLHSRPLRVSESIAVHLWGE